MKITEYHWLLNCYYKRNMYTSLHIHTHDHTDIDAPIIADMFLIYRGQNGNGAVLVFTDQCTLGGTGP